MKIWQMIAVVVIITGLLVWVGVRFVPLVPVGIAWMC